MIFFNCRYLHIFEWKRVTGGSWEKWFETQSQADGISVFSRVTGFRQQFFRLRQ